MCASDRFFGYFQREERGRDSFSVGRLGKSGELFSGGAREMRKREILERRGREESRLMRWTLPQISLSFSSQRKLKQLLMQFDIAIEHEHPERSRGDLEGVEAR